MYIVSVFQEAVQLNPIFQGSSVEDTFIEQMALGRIVVWNNKQHIEASSLEGLITHVIEVYSLHDVLCVLCVIIEPPRGKTNNLVFEQVRHKPSCMSTEEC